jgi:hypothetical protein
MKRQLDSGEPVVIIDLRSELDVAAVPFMIPRSLRIALEELERRHQEIPPGPGYHPVLLVTERSDERPGGARSQAARSDAREASRGRIPRVAGAWTPG